MSVDEILLRSRFQPLERILCYDVFNTGFNGWMTLLPNFTEYPDFDVPPTLVNKDQWPPVMLSSATYRYPGSHGAMSGTFSLKLSTRPVHSPYEEIPAPGSMGHAIKRLSFYRPGSRYLQIECWFSYTAEQDSLDPEGTPQPGLHEKSIRAFGMGFDIQERGERYQVGVRHLNCFNGNLVQRWEIENSADVMGIRSRRRLVQARYRPMVVRTTIPRRKARSVPDYSGFTPETDLQRNRL